LFENCIFISPYYPIVRSVCNFVGMKNSNTMVTQIYNLKFTESMGLQSFVVYYNRYDDTGIIDVVFPVMKNVRRIRWNSETKEVRRFDKGKLTGNPELFIHEPTG